MAKTTIVTKEGERVTGEVVPEETSWGEIASRVLTTVATAGGSEIMRPDPDVTVVDKEGNEHTGTEVKK